VDLGHTPDADEADSDDHVTPAVRDRPGQYCRLTPPPSTEPSSG